MEEQKKELKINADNQILKGAYANMMQISHSREEFVLDFMFAHPPAGQLVSRVITSPGHLKRIIMALQDNLKKYETNFGGVQEAEEPGEIGFKAE